MTISPHDEESPPPSPKASDMSITEEPRGTEQRITELEAEFKDSQPSPASDEPEGQVPNETQAAWLFRAGRKGEFAESFIDNGIAALDFGWSDDLSEVSSRDEMVGLAKGDRPESSDGQAIARAAQLWAIRSEVRRGDLVVMPRRSGAEFTLGTVTREYWYRHDSDRMPHAVSVDWKRNGVPRTAVRQDLLASLNHRRTITRIRDEDATRRLQQLLETGRDPGPPANDETGLSKAELDLPALVEQFRSETGYPTEAHMEQKRLRKEWAEKLAPENIANLSRHDLTAVASHGTRHSGIYVHPHAQGVMQWIEDLDDDEYSRVLDHIRYLCWDEDELWRRYDQLTDSRSDRRTKGLVHSTTGRLLAICHPNEFLAIGVQGGRWGRAAMLHRLGLPKPTGSSYGQRVLDANDRLREHLEPDFGDDTLEMGAFLGWFLDQEPPPASGPMNLAELADELLVDVSSWRTSSN